MNQDRRVFTVIVLVVGNNIVLVSGGIDPRLATPSCTPGNRLVDQMVWDENPPNVGHHTFRLAEKREEGGRTYGYFYGRCGRRLDIMVDSVDAAEGLLGRAVIEQLVSRNTKDLLMEEVRQSGLPQH
ncbi:MAG: hypothetical protein K8Q91_02065 [Candidatus Vogelbacteria bacterium]|nr:hypothetical protein [Candidatus Vogelbacteria bacterium]